MGVSTIGLITVGMYTIGMFTISIIKYDTVPLVVTNHPHLKRFLTISLLMYSIDTDYSSLRFSLSH